MKLRGFNSTERVGIGTTAPVSALDIGGTGAASWNTASKNSGLLTIGDSAGDSSLVLNLPTHNVYYPASFTVDGVYSATPRTTTVRLKALGVKYSSWHADFAFHTSNGTSESEKMRITYDGNVGIGTTAPSAKVDIHHATEPVLRLTNTKSWGVSDSGNMGSLEFYTTDASTPGGARVLSSIVCANNAGSSVPNGELIFSTALGGGSGAVATERMRITDDGKVGIGTTAPSDILQVDNTANGGEARVIISNRYQATSSLDETTTLMFGFGNTSSSLVRGAQLEVVKVGDYSATANRKTKLNITTRDGDDYNGITIDEKGNVGIGTTSPSQKLEVDGDIRILDARSLFFKRYGDNYAWRVRNESASDNSTYGFDGANDLVFEVVSNSNTNATPGASSHSIYGNTANTLVLKETGRIGIGTIDPGTYKLYCNGTSFFKDGVELDNSLDVGGATTLTSLTGTSATFSGAVTVGTKKYEDFETSGHFYLGNNDWASLINNQSGVTYSATHKGMSFNNQSGAIPCLIPIDPLATYRVKVRIKQVTVTTGTGRFYFAVQTLNENKTNLSSDTATSYNYGVALNAAHSAGTTATYENTFSGYNATNEGDNNKFDPEGKYFNLYYICNYQGSGEVVIQSIEVERLPDSIWVGDSTVIDSARNITGTTATFSGKVGIGNTAPYYSLDIADGAMSTGKKVGIGANHNGGTAIVNDMAALILGPTGSRVGTANHYMGGGIAFNHLMRFNSAFDSSWNDHMHAYIGMRFKDNTNAEASHLIFATNNSDTKNASPTERMVIESDGNVGIGTTAPGTYKLYVNGTAYVNTSLVVGAVLDASTSGVDVGVDLEVAGDTILAGGLDMSGGGNFYDKDWEEGTDGQILYSKGDGVGVQWGTLDWEDLPNISTLDDLP